MQKERRKLVALVGCGKTKLSRPAPARELYTGPLFQAARSWAERNAEAWWICSALHGLVTPHTVLEPYEKRLPRGLEGTERWGTGVASDLSRVIQLTPWFDDDLVVGAQVHVVVLAGADYAGPVCAHLGRLGIPYEQPLRGLQVGERLAWFKKQRTEGASCTHSRSTR